jgi:O-antigen ligase
MVLVCGLVLIWDWLERSRDRDDAVRQRWFDRYLPAGLLAIGVYLLYLCDSKTSIACLVVGGCILAATRLPLLRTRISALGICVVAAGIGLYVLDSVFGLKEELVQSVGRDMTLTGRTEVWHELLALKTDPIVGTGFCSFWSDEFYQSRLPEWLAEGRSAHDGFLEMYLDGGILGLFFLGLMLVVIGLRINRQLGEGGYYPVVRFAVFVVMLVANLTESHFGRMSPVGFLFLLAALDPPAAQEEHTSQEILQGGPTLTEEWADSTLWPGSHS